MSTKLNNIFSTLIAAFSGFAILAGLTAPALGQVPFSCNNQVFITQDPRLEDPVDPDVIQPVGRRDNYLYVVDTSAWPSAIDFDVVKRLESPVGTPIVVNPVGFRRTDGLLYGWRRGPRPREMVQIDATGEVFPLGPVAGLPQDDAFVAGDISPDGSEMYFVCVGTISNDVPLRLYTVPLLAGGPGSATSVAITLGEGSEDPSIDDPTDNVADWAVSPLDGLLYGGDRDGELVILDPATAERVDLAVPGLPGGKGYGAAWFNAAGRLFLYWNDGEIFEIDVTGPPIIVSSHAESSSRRNDGARCIPPPFTHTIFLSSATFDGNLGGLEGADAECQNLADAAGMVDRVWKAILSDSETDARDRLTISGPIFDTRSQFIANGFRDLIDGGISNFVEFDENGDPWNDEPVWTGSRWNGDRYSTSGPVAYKQDWTSSTGAAMAGGTMQMDAGWLEWLSWSGPARLYCIDGQLSEAEINTRRDRIRSHFAERLAQMGVVATTVTQSGQTIDWIWRDPQSSDGFIATPPGVVPPEQLTTGRTVSAPEKVAMQPPVSEGKRSAPELLNAGGTVSAREKLIVLPPITGGDESAQTELQTQPAAVGPPGTVPVARFDVEAYLASVEIPPENPQDVLKKVAPAPESNDRYYAVWHRYRDAFYGSSGRINIWNTTGPVDNETSIAQVAVIRGSPMQAIEAGKIEVEGLNGNLRPHFFTYFRTGGSASGDWKGGYNTLVDGWIQYSSTVCPGISLEPWQSSENGSQYALDVEVRLHQGNWWVKAAGEWAGYYPKCMGGDAPPCDTGTLFSSKGIRDKASRLDWYGEIYDSSAPAATSTDMGSGDFAADGWQHAAYFRNLTYFWAPTTYWWWDSGSVSVTASACYSRTGPFYSSDTAWRNWFFYGGPGKEAAGCN